MKTLRFLFNFARTVSLLIVLALIALLGLSYHNGELQKAFADASRMQEMQEETNLDFEFGPSNKDQITFYGEKISLRSSSHRYYFLPDQIAYIENKKGDVMVKLVNDSIPFENISFTKLSGELMRGHKRPFFFTRDYIINPVHVTQSFSSNEAAQGSYYKHYAVMTTGGDPIPIPKEKYPAFLSLMDSIAVSIN